MTAAGHQMSINPPANSPFRSRSYANFVKDQELQQAKADVEECYRRRARRAGLEETLPVGRPMTDEEIDDLKWMLGDFGPANGYGSRGTKCSKEVIDMTIEEMEAEIQETNELIRKRRRGNLGLMLKPIWMLTCLMVSSVDAFTAYDCSNWSNVVESYSLLEPDACTNMGRDGEVETTVYGVIVQIKQDRTIPVFRCTVVETLVAQYCGMFSAAGVTRYIRFRELSPWRPGSAGRLGRTVCSPSTDRSSAGRSEQQLPTPCSCPEALTMRATARWAWLLSATARY
jgi:hypothetical protein